MKKKNYLVYLNKVECRALSIDAEDKKMARIKADSDIAYIPDLMGFKITRIEEVK